MGAREGVGGGNGAVHVAHNIIRIIAHRGSKMYSQSGHQKPEKVPSNPRRRITRSAPSGGGGARRPRGTRPRGIVRPAVAGRQLPHQPRAGHVRRLVHRRGMHRAAELVPCPAGPETAVVSRRR